MSDAPILKDTERTTGRSALQNNIQAAMALAGAVRSTLGPRGLDKLLIDDDMKQQAMQLVRSVAIADGELDAAEEKAINVLSEVLDK